MIVAGPEGFRKSHYRKFNIRSADLTPGDDFAMMREVLTRRFKRLLAEAPNKEQRVHLVASPLGGEPDPAQPEREGGDRSNPTFAPSLPIPPPQGGTEENAAPDAHDESPWPDLVLIDGGQGQLTAAREVLTTLGLTIPIAAIAKGPERDAGRETFFIPGRDSFKLPPRDPVLYFVERLRDEAHRFAIGSHRARRKRDLREAGLQEIAGIGPTRKRALLLHFGTLKAIERASLTDLMEVKGVSAETARRIYAFFHDGATAT
jgi:excinuclease ABC subunit C